MSKVVQAINAMISHPEKISQVTQSYQSREVFFVYNEKHKWSMTHSSKDDRYVLHYYPSDISIETLVTLEGHDWEAVQMVSYVSSDLGGREAVASMRELYNLLREKVHGVDAVLDEIIADDIPF